MLQRNTQDFYKHNCFRLPLWLWQELLEAYPALASVAVWDPFYDDGASKCRMREAGFKHVRHTKTDCYGISHKWKSCLIVSNPPFSIKAQILQHLFLLERAFVLLLPVRSLFTKYFQPWRHLVKLIIPTKTFATSAMTVDCVFVCYKLDQQRSSPGATSATLFSCPLCPFHI